MAGNHDSLRDPLSDLSSEGKKEKNFPKIITKRVKALTELLLAQHHVDEQFNEERHLLICKYNKLYTDSYNKRNDIVNGNYEPTDEECDFPSDDENYDGKDVSVDEAGIAKLTHSKPATPKVNVGSDQIKGIPNFWLTVLKNIPMISNSIQPHDELILSHLTDIKIRLLDTPKKFILEFCFSPNKWFTNTVLTKKYDIEYISDENNKFDFNGLRFYSCEGCEIQWNKGKNVTVKKVTLAVKKKENKEGQDPFRFVRKIINNVSFFHFFGPPTLLNIETFLRQRNISRALEADYEVGFYIREKVIPKAVLFYTGEALINFIKIVQPESKCDSEEDINAGGNHFIPGDEEMINIINQ